MFEPKNVGAAILKMGWKKGEKNLSRGKNAGGNDHRPEGTKPQSKKVRRTQEGGNADPISGSAGERLGRGEKSRSSDGKVRTQEGSQIHTEKIKQRGVIQ